MLDNTFFRVKKYLKLIIFFLLCFKHIFTVHSLRLGLYGKVLMKIFMVFTKKAFKHRMTQILTKTLLF